MRRFAQPDYVWRKKPIEIEAWHFMPGNANNPQPIWLQNAFLTGVVWYQGGDAPYITVKTLEGEMRADAGDWILRGVKGELYPCKDDIFTETYERPAIAGPMTFGDN